VFRLVAAILFALLVGQATGLAAATGMVCTDSCPDDNGAGQCSPFCACATCGCHSLRPAVLVRVAAIPAPRAVQFTFEQGDKRYLPPEPDEILHVPKSCLAELRVYERRRRGAACLQSSA
jgi:hypothetical protein